MDRVTKIVLLVLGALGIGGTGLIGVVTAVIVALKSKGEPAPTQTPQPINWTQPSTGTDPDAYRRPNFGPDTCPGPDCPSDDGQSQAIG